MRIILYSAEKSHSLAIQARFSTKTYKNLEIIHIDSIDDDTLSSMDLTDNIGLLIIENNLSSIITELKSSKVRIPIIAATSDFEAKNIINLLDVGYDDVIKHPGDLDEIIARFRAISRRDLNYTSNKINHGRLVTYLDGRDPEVDGKRLKLTKIEYDILDVITRRAGTIISREKLFERIWPDGHKQPFDKVLDVHIFNLRNKLKKISGGETFIETLPQRGYRLS